MNLTPDDRERLERASALALNGILAGSGTGTPNMEWALDPSVRLAAGLLERVDRAAGAQNPERWREAMRRAAGGGAPG